MRDCIAISRRSQRHCFLDVSNAVVLGKHAWSSEGSASDVGAIPEETVSEWLSLAASITSVQADIIRHNLAFGYCSSGDRYDLARDELIEARVYRENEHTGAAVGTRPSGGTA